MKRFLAAMVLMLPIPGMADHLDVIEFKMKEGCSWSSYLAIVKDFNEWAKAYGYRTEILMPLQRSNLESMFWVGRSANAGTFGKAWDVWRDAQSNPDSAPAKLNARFAACTTNVSRSSYDTY